MGQPQPSPSHKRLFFSPFLVGILSLSVAACGGGEAEQPAAPVSAAPAASSPSGPPPSGAAQVTVNMAGSTGLYEYDPGEFTFKVGETVDFTLVGDPELHTFTISSLGVDWSLAPEETKTFAFTFSTAGTYKVVCIPHPEMKGTIVVQ